MRTAISVITAVHNSLAMNRLYWKSLSENTFVPFELIVVDNHSTDGSETFFADLSRADLPPGQSVIYRRNETNQSYPVSQIQGMRLARHPVFCFLNNDLWLPKGWHVPLTEALAGEPYLIVSPSGQEAQPNQHLSTRLKRRWRRVTRLSRVWQRCLGRSEEQRLWKSLQWMYGDLAHFRSPTPVVGAGYFSGIKGDSVCFRRELLDRIPEPWDPRIEAADWHLYLCAARLHEREPDTVPLPRVILSSYTHHFGRYSARQKFEPLPPSDPFLSIEQVWGAEAKRLWWGNYLPA